MVAQRLEQNAYIIQVMGSIPIHTTMKNKYSHAVGISILGLMVVMMDVPPPVLLYRFVGGFMIGIGLRLARQHGRDEK